MGSLRRVSDSKADLTLAIRQKRTFTNTPGPANCCLISNPQASACKENYLRFFFHHIDIQSSSKQTRIPCPVFSVVPTVWEIISRDLSKERTEREADLSKKGILLRALAL